MRDQVRIFLIVHAALDVAFAVAIVLMVGNPAFPMVLGLFGLLVSLGVAAFAAGLWAWAPALQRTMIQGIGVADATAGCVLILMAWPGLAGSLSSAPLTPIAYVWPVVGPLMPGVYLLAAGALSLLISRRPPNTLRAAEVPR